MRIYLAYKLTDSDTTSLKSLIELVSNKLESLGHDTFCFYRDIEDWGIQPTARADIIPLALKNLDTCDAVLFIISEESKSTGMGIEAGYAKAKNKKIFLAKKKDIETDYILSLSANNFEYTFPEELEMGVMYLLS